MARGGKKLRKQCHTTSQNKRLTSQPPGNGRWAFGGIVEYAGAIVSGIRKIVAKIRYPQFSYSSKGNSGEYCHANGIHASNKSEKISLIEQLIKDLTFSREECYSLTLLFESHVTDWPMEVEKIPTIIPGKWADIVTEPGYRKAITEAKKWYIEQKKLDKTHKWTDELILPGTEHKGSAKLRDQTVEVNSFEEYPKQEISALKEQLKNAFEEQLKRITEKVESTLGETIHRLEQQLAAEQAARLVAEKLLRRK